MQLRSRRRSPVYLGNGSSGRTRMPGGITISDAIICEDKGKYMDITTSLEIPPHIAEKVWKSCKKKEIPKEGLMDMDHLDDYTPSYSEFLGFIETKKKKPTN